MSSMLITVELVLNRVCQEQPKFSFSCHILFVKIKCPENIYLKGNFYIKVFTTFATNPLPGLPIMFGLNHRPTSAHSDNKRNQSENSSNSSFSGSLNVTEPEPNFCGFYNPDFIIYSSLGSFYIPCIIMVVLYTRIFRVRNNVCRNI